MHICRPLLRNAAKVGLVCALAGWAWAAPPTGSDASESHERATLNRVQQLEWSRAPAQEVVPFLKAPEAAVRARAALALGRLQDWTVAEDLVPLLSDTDPQVRRTGAFALGLMDPVMPLLMDQIKAGLKGEDPRVRGPAMARAAAEKKVDARLHLEERADVRRALYGALGPLAVGAGLHHLQFGLEATPVEAGWAARALGVHGHRRRQQALRDPETLATLHTLLTSPNEEARFGATYATFRLHAKDVPGLTERLGTDPDVRVRIHAARGLAGLLGSEDALVAALRDPDWRVRVEAVRALAEATKPRGLSHAADLAALGAAGLDALHLFLKTDSLAGATAGHVVSTVVVALAKAPPAATAAHLDALAALLGLPNVAGLPAEVQKAQPWVRHREQTWQVACSVAAALDVVAGAPSRVAGCGLPGEPAWWPNARALDVQTRIPGSDAEKARRLAGYLSHEAFQVRALAADALGETSHAKAPDVATLLAERVGVEPDPLTAVALVQALKARALAEHAPALRASLARFVAQPGDGHDAAAAAADLLASVGSPDDVPAVRPLLESPSARVRALAWRALTALKATPPPPGPVAPVWSPEALKALPTHATIRTAKGDITLRFYREDAPLTVVNFARLARQGFYNSLTFHRVVPNFVVQGGDPRGDGNGGPGYTIPCEYNPRPYERGVVGMALGGKDTGGSQFFITHSPQPHLDGLYTAFAEVESGMDVVDALQAGDRMLAISIRP